MQQTTCIISHTPAEGCRDTPHLSVVHYSRSKSDNTIQLDKIRKEFKSRIKVQRYCFIALWFICSVTCVMIFIK